MVQDDRRNLIKGVAAASGLAVIGATGSAAASTDNEYQLDGDGIEALENFSTTLTWEDSGFQGSENANLCCTENSTGVWNWILTGGGSTFVSASLEVTFSDEDSETVEAEFPGIGNVAQFPVEREFAEDDCITVEAAEATFTLDSPPVGNQVLTISSSECLNGIIPPEEIPKKKDKKERKKFEKEFAKRKYLLKKLKYKRRKKSYKEAKSEYKKAKKYYEKRKEEYKEERKEKYRKKREND